MFVKIFEDCLLELENLYKSKSDKFFFTEKEIHSYFYSICLSKNIFLYKDYNLVHTEYPTPFKASILKDPPYFKVVNNESKFMRSHIDLVLLNPNFIDWCEKNNLPFNYIKGLKNESFSKYIVDFVNIYNRFYSDTNEPILLYAIEFKYFRGGYEGTKYPIIAVKQDLEKLNSLKQLKFGTRQQQIPFTQNVRSKIFFENNCSKIIDKINLDPIFKNYQNMFDIIIR
tara:strand:- start:342 stop:1022 length:681 start_codon:yes stop_codon:yes gene_type:complete